ncbi:MAG: leucine-rich repeat domain-containing protein, partial [Clostridiales bacterium]|nr:leucine-rich repeat domain-containing protein [Clostridiales bacterium]
GCLRISGTGPMYDYRWDSEPMADREKIRSVIIEEGITTIGNRAFLGCSNLTSISMPDSLTRIGGEAVYVCDLESVTIPKNVESIGTWAFSASDRLTEIRVAEGNTHFSTYDGALYNKERTTLLMCPAGKESYTVPEGVTNIDQAFQACHRMTRVVLPEGLTQIGSYTFANLSELTSLTIPRSMRVIETYAFENCESLTDIYYSGTVTEWGQVGIYGTNEPLFADQCTIHCTDGDTKAEPSPDRLSMSQYSSYSESGIYFAPGLPLGGDGLHSETLLFEVSAWFPDSEQPAEDPVWTLEQTAGTASAEMTDGGNRGYKFIMLTAMPAQEETAVWHVTCEWGGKTQETDLTMTFREAPSLPAGVEYTGESPWLVPVGGNMEITGQFRFSDGWSLPGAPTEAFLGNAAPEFFTATEYDNRVSAYKAKVPGIYNVEIMVRCVNIYWYKDMTVCFTDANGVLPLGSYVSPAKKILELPDSVTSVPEEAFRGIAAQAVILPENCASIGAYAFADSNDLAEVRLPGSLPVSEIDEHAFDGCTGLTVIVARTAEQVTWAKEHGYIPVK